MDGHEHDAWGPDEERRLTELLAALPGDEPPEGFFAEIDAALGVRPPRRSRDKGRRLAPRVPRAARGASWAVRGPAAAFSGTGGLGGVRRSFDGLSAARYALGPLAPKRKTSKRPLWQRALGVGG